MILFEKTIRAYSQKLTKHCFNGLNRLNSLQKIRINLTRNEKKSLELEACTCMWSTCLNFQETQILAGSHTHWETQTDFIHAKKIRFPNFHRIKFYRNGFSIAKTHEIAEFCDTSHYFFHSISAALFFSFHWIETRCKWSLLFRLIWFFKKTIRRNSQKLTEDKDENPLNCFNF